MLEAVIFDLDGTLVNSELNFPQIKESLGLPEKCDILEEIKKWAPDKQLEGQILIQEFEMEGARKATLIEGASELLHDLKKNSIKLGLLTRNFKGATEFTINKFSFEFDLVYTRECAMPKPHPEAILEMINRWDVSPENTYMIGDFKYDVETGQNAGTKTALFNPNEKDSSCCSPDFIFSQFSELHSHLLDGKMPLTSFLS